MRERFSLAGRLRSVAVAVRGILLVLRSQQNAWIHAVITVGVVGMGLLFRVTVGQWCALILAMMSVWTAEALNTALELLADAVSREPHPLIGKAKDVAAGAVLLSAAGAILVGIMVLGPPFVAMIEGVLR